MTDDEKNDFGNEMLEAIVGKENWERILDGIGVDNIRPFTQEVYDYYGLGGPESPLKLTLTPKLR